MIFSGVLHRQDLSGRHTSRMWVRRAPGLADPPGMREAAQRAQDTLHPMPAANLDEGPHLRNWMTATCAGVQAPHVPRCTRAAMSPHRDTAIRHSDVQPHCVILKQSEQVNVDPRIRLHPRVAHRARRARCAAPNGCARANSRRARRGDRRLVRDDKRRALASGCHAPRHRQQQRGQVYHRSSSPGHRRTRKSTLRRSAIAYSLLLDRRCARQGPLDPRRPARSRNLPSACARPASAGSDPARLPDHAARCCMATGKPVSLGSSIYAAGCGMSQATQPGPRAGAQERHSRHCARALGLARPHMAVRRYTHARWIGGGDQGPAPFFGPIAHEPSSRGTRALIVCAATC
jgi:hypothetical protein